MSLGFAHGRPAGTGLGPDGQRPELVEGETPLREAGADLFDAVQLGFPVRLVEDSFHVRVRLEGDLVLAQVLPQPFTADQHGPHRVVGQVVGELADATPG
ncbi:hypothetical protein LDL49_53570 [Nonomuraea sp. NEAU-L178]|nr:hypothetical protein [Nonomuraea aurantiaca]